METKERIKRLRDDIKFYKNQLKESKELLKSIKTNIKKFGLDEEWKKLEDATSKDIEWEKMVVNCKTDGLKYILAQGAK